MRLCIIGAGAAGLSACRHMKNLNGCQITAYEALDRVGGMWNYDDKPSSIVKRGQPVLYKGLRTNLPKEIMAYPDFSFNNDLAASFVSHQSVAEYLHAYAAHHHLEPLIKFGHNVTSVERLTDGHQSTWSVEAKNLKNNQITTETFDAVIVCNGHLSAPKMPILEGSDNFQGVQMHACDYRRPEMFKGKKVACLGAGPSGIDIAIELNDHADKVYLCHNGSRLRSQMPGGIEETVGIEKLEATKAILLDKKVIDIDALVLCTGYKYNFPFIKKNCQLKVKQDSVSPLYLHMIHVHFPNLIFIGLSRTILPFPFFDVQAKFIAQLLKGNVQLPSAEEMLNYELEERKKRLSLDKVAHDAFMYMGPMQWPYLDHLASLGKFDPLPPYFQHIYKRLTEIRATNLAHYKSYRIRVLNNDGDFEIYRPQDDQTVTYKITD